MVASSIRLGWADAIDLLEQNLPGVRSKSSKTLSRRMVLDQNAHLQIRQTTAANLKGVAHPGNRKKILIATFGFGFPSIRRSRSRGD